MNVMTGARLCFLLLLAAVSRGDAQSILPYQQAAQAEAARVGSALNCLQVGVVALPWEESRANSAGDLGGGIFSGTGINNAACANGGGSGADGRVLGPNWLITFYRPATAGPRTPREIDIATSDLTSAAQACADSASGINAQDARQLTDCILKPSSAQRTFGAFLVVLGPLQASIGTSIPPGFPFVQKQIDLYTSTATLTSFKATFCFLI